MMPDKTASTAGYIDANASELLFLLTYAVFKAAHIAECLLTSTCLKIDCFRQQVWLIRDEEDGNVSIHES